MSLFVNNKILDLLMLFSEAGGCSKHFFGVRCSFGHPMEGFQSFFPNFVTHQILLCTPKLKRPCINTVLIKIKTDTLYKPLYLGVLLSSTWKYRQSCCPQFVLTFASMFGLFLKKMAASFKQDGRRLARLTSLSLLRASI